MNNYIITTTGANDAKLYFLHDFASFTTKHKTIYKGKRAAVGALEYAKKCCGTKQQIDHLAIEKI